MLDRLPVILAILLARVALVAVERVERRQRVEPPALVVPERLVRGAHARDTRTAAGRRNLDAVEDRRGRRALAIGVIRVPSLRRLLTVAVPDQSDQREFRHVVLRVDRKSTR